MFDSGVPLAMAGLDVTHQALMLPPDIARLEATGTRAGRVFADLMRFFGVASPASATAGTGRRSTTPSPSLRLTHPELLIDGRSLRVDVATDDGLTRGATIADGRASRGGRPTST